MATYSGALSSSPEFDTYDRLQDPSNRAQPEFLPADQAGGTDEGGGPGHSVPTPLNTFVGALDPYHGDFWFDRVHLIPRDDIKFGNILGQVIQDFELFSAYREPTTVTLTTINDNLGDGTDAADDISTPTSMAPFTSILDSTSTRLNPVKTSLVADQEGAPTFNGTYEFVFDSGDVVALSASGNRIAVWPIKHETDFQERIEFKTDVMEALSGKEQRIALRACPRTFYDLNYRLTGDSRQRAQIHLQGWQSNLWALPMFHNGTKLTAAASATDTSVTVENTDNRDFRVGGQMILWQDEQVYEAVTISAVTSTTIEFTSTPLTRAFANGVEIYPARLAYIARAIQGRRFATELEDFRLEWRVWDNDTGSPTGDTSAYSTYNSKVLFDECNLMDGDSMQVTHDAKVKFIDNQTGIIKAYSRQAAKHKRGSTQGFFMATRAEILQVQRLLIALQGRQKSFYLPTFINDLTLTADFFSPDSTIDVEGIELERFLTNIEHPRKIVRIVCTDGTVITRTIVSTLKVSDTLNRITLDSTLGVDKTVAEVSRIEFQELVRFDADRFNFRYRRPGQATLVAPVLTVYD